MSLPPLPPPHPEGGPAQSSVDPGDTGRELLHEVRNLKQAVVLLQQVSLPRDEANKRDKVLREETYTSRKAILSRIYLVALLLVVVILSAVAFVVDRDVRDGATQRTNCKNRVVSTTSVQKYVAEQIAIETMHPSLPETVRSKRLASLQTLSEAFPIPKCPS